MYICISVSGMHGGESTIQPTGPGSGAALLQERSLPIWLEVSWTTKRVHSASCSLLAHDELHG